MAWIGDVVPCAQRQQVLARLLIGQITGLAIGVWIGGYTAEHLDWRTPFFFISGLFGLVTLSLFMLQRRVPAVSHRPVVQIAARRTSLLAEFRAVFETRWARVVLLTIFCEGLALYGAFPFIAAHLHLHLGLSLAASGALLLVRGGWHGVRARCATDHPVR